jgi:manganese transport protein
VLSIGRDCCKIHFHVVETVGAMLYGENIDDHELVDEERLLKDW